MIDPNADRPLYRQIADLLRAQIESGELPPGAKIPTADFLARMHHVGVDTAREALGLLRSEGRIVMRQGHPTRVVEPVERTQVRVQRGATMEDRPATAEERQRYGLPDSGYVVEIRLGAKVTTYPGGRYIFTFS